MEIFLVGGAVRDRMLGRESKDWDFTVVMDPAECRPLDPFSAMVDVLTNALGFTVFQEDVQHGTVRARAPKGWTFGGVVPPVRTFDFVLARRDVSTDGRRAVTEPGTLFDDLRRRDFTMNAIAQAADGTLIDPFGGQRDIERRTIRAVGTPEARMVEDGLRVLRAVRFAVTLGFGFSGQTRSALKPGFITDSVSVERIREELDKACRVDWLATFRWLERLGLLSRIQETGVWFMPTQKSR